MPSPRDRRGRSVSPAGAGELHQLLVPVLADLAFPAARWQVVTAADLYGCDNVTRTVLAGLPERRYLAIGEVVAVLAAVLEGRPLPPEQTGPIAPTALRRVLHTAPARGATAQPARVPRGAGGRTRPARPASGPRPAA